MATAAFLAWQAAPFGARAVLCHLTLRQTVSGFVSVGSGTYVINVGMYTHPQINRWDRGFWQELIGCKENVTTLVDGGGPGGVMSTPGSWYWDPASGLLYVQRVGSGDPDAEGTRIQIVIRIRFATEPPYGWRQFPDQPPYYPVLDGSGLPEFRQEQTDPLAPVSSYPSGRVTFTNAGGMFDYLAVAYDWSENDCEFRVGGGTLAYSDYEVVVRAQVSRSPAAKNDLCEVLLRSSSNITNAVYPRHTYDQVVAGAANAGKYMPMLWGTVFDVPLHYLSAGSFPGNGLYVVMDPGMVDGYPITVTELRAYDRATGVLAAVLPGSAFFLPGSGASGTVELDGTTYPRASYTFRADVVRPGLSKKGSVAWDLLTQGCGIPTTEIDAAAFAQADIDDPNPVGLYVAGNETETVGAIAAGSGDFFSVAVSIQQLLDRLAPFFQVYRTAAGLWTCKVWDPGMPDLATVPRLTSADFVTFEPIVREAASDGVELQSSVTVRYAPRQVAGASSAVTVSSGATAALIGRENSGPPVTSPYVTVAANAGLASRLLALAGVVGQEFHAVVGPRLFLAAIGDKVLVQRPRGPSLAPTFDQVLEVQAITKRLNDLTCDVVLGNMRGLGETVKAYAPDGTPDYASASPDEQRRYLFYAADGTPGPTAGVFW